MAYRVEIAPLARRQLRKLERATQLRLIERIEALGANPRPAGTKKLAGGESLYRIRVGEYRVIYQVRDQVLVVLVKIGHRRDVYP